MITVEMCLPPALVKCGQGDLMTYGRFQRFTIITHCFYAVDCDHCLIIIMKYF